MSIDDFALKPTLGRIVLYHPVPGGAGFLPKLVFPAIVMAIEPDGRLELLVVQSDNDVHARHLVPPRTDQRRDDAWSFAQHDLDLHAELAELRARLAALEPKPTAEESSHGLRH